MQKLTSKKLIVTAFLAGVLGLSSVPLGASANSYHNDNRDWYSRHDYRRCYISDRDARYIAERLFPQSRFDRVNHRWYDNDRDYDVVFTNGCHVVIRGSDGRVVRIYYQW
jgi:hypothetical protein